MFKMNLLCFIIVFFFICVKIEIERRDKREEKKK